MFMKIERLVWINILFKFSIMSEEFTPGNYSISNFTLKSLYVTIS
jgi:hypothetical protein